MFDVNPEGNRLGFREFSFEMPDGEDPVIFDPEFNEKLLRATEFIQTDFLSDETQVKGRLRRTYTQLEADSEDQSAKPVERSFDIRVQRIAGPNGVEIVMQVANCKEGEVEVGNLPDYAHQAAKLIRKYRTEGLKITLTDIDTYDVNMTKGWISHSGVIIITLWAGNKIQKQFKYDVNTDYSGLGESGDKPKGSGLSLLDELEAELTGSDIDSEYQKISLAEKARKAYIIEIASTFAEFGIILPGT